MDLAQAVTSTCSRSHFVAQQLYLTILVTHHSVKPQCRGLCLWRYVCATSTCTTVTACLHSCSASQEVVWDVGMHHRSNPLNGVSWCKRRCASCLLWVMAQASWLFQLLTDRPDAKRLCYGKPQLVSRYELSLSLQLAFHVPCFQVACWLSRARLHAVRNRIPSTPSIHAVYRNLKREDSFSLSGLLLARCWLNFMHVHYPTEQ